MTIGFYHHPTQPSVVQGTLDIFLVLNSHKTSRLLALDLWTEFELQINFRQAMPSILSVFGSILGEFVHHLTDQAITWSSFTVTVLL